MPTTKKRLNLTLPSDLETLLKILAKRDNVPLATKAIQLINEAIEMEEDLMLSRIAEERLAEIENGESEVISHEDFWKLALQD